MNKVLVTGAGGYIGSVLVDKLLKSGYHVKAVDRLFFGRDKLSYNNNLELIKEDTRKLDRSCLSGVDFVIDLAAISNDPSAEQFSKATSQINADARIGLAHLSKEAGIKRYILPSSASIYGYNDDLVDENSPVNPLTVYAEANYKAEQNILPLADDSFTAVVIRQATVYGYSKRMRFDLAINGMTYGSWKNKKLPLMRDGKQYRPMVHVQDTTDLMVKLLDYDSSLINGEIFNVGSNENNYQIEDLGHRITELVSDICGCEVEIEWYGDPDKRSYRLDFSKIQSKLNWKPKVTLEEGVREIIEHLESGDLDKTASTITLEWYKELVHWHKIIKEVEKYGGILDIE